MTRKDILRLLRDPDAEELRKRAEKALLAAKGSHVHVRGLIEFSNICRRNCLYCGLRAQNSALRRYRLSQEEILAAAAGAIAQGADSIVLQSGEGSCDPAWLAEVVAELKKHEGIAITLSVGEGQARDYALWRNAGASRYLIKHETASPALYARLHPGHKLGERIRALLALRDLGYEIGSGFMIGLPGQKLEDLAGDIALCRALRVDMCGAGPFIPQADTPLAGEACGSVALTLRALSVLRLALPWANLPATTALASLDPEKGQTAGLMAGANVLMPSFTPPRAAVQYRIYDHKNRVGMANAVRAIEKAGRSHGLRPR